MTQRLGDITISAPGYTLTLPSDRPYAYVDTPGGRVAELFLLSTADSTRGTDATTAVEEWQRAESDTATVLTLTAGSTIWDRRVYRLRCTDDCIQYTASLEGSAALADVTYFGGYNAAHPRWGAGLFHSGHRFGRGFNPEPDAAGSLWFDPLTESTIDLGGGPLPGRRHWFFTPAPFCFAFEADEGWLGFGLEAEPGRHRFTEFRYRGGDGFRLTVPYDGRTRADGSYVLPAIGLTFAGSAYDALRLHVERLRFGMPKPSRDPARWWREPIFCGWGAQCHAAAANGYRPENGPDAGAFMATLPFAADFAGQTNYEGWVDLLDRHGVRPGTVVIDDKWQDTYGDNGVDPRKWPDLPGFVARRHEAGQHVLLWIKAWDREGIPDAECIRTGAGRALTVDPTNPDFERRLRASVRRMISPHGYDADGFKIDFTHRIPVGPGLRLHGDCWGLELMRLYLAIIHDEARRSKPDALVIAHAPHPYLSDVVDMVRLNDMLDLSLPRWQHVDVITAMRRRADVARISRPDALIDTDNWPVPDRQTWRAYVRAQPEMGVPALYFAGGIDLTQEPLGSDDYQLIRETWERYRLQ